MKRPDPKACARIAANIREYCTSKQPSYLLLDDELATVRDALKFCAREPEGIGTNQRILGLRAAPHGVLRALRNEDIGGARDRATEAIGLDDGAMMKALEDQNDEG